MEDRIFKILKVTSVIMIIYMILRGIVYYTEYQDEKTYNEVKEALDDIVRYQKKNGKEVATTSVARMDAIGFLKMKGLEEDNKRLQELVSKYKKEVKNASIVKTETKIVTTTKTEVIRDTINNNPVYVSNFDLNGWVDGKVVADKDSTKIEVGVKDELHLVVYDKNMGLFKDRKTMIDVYSLNPYSKVKQIKSFTVDDRQKKSKISIGPFVGFGVTGKGTLQPTIGVGLQYNLIRL